MRWITIDSHLTCITTKEHSLYWQCVTTRPNHNNPLRLLNVMKEVGSYCYLTLIDTAQSIRLTTGTFTVMMAQRLAHRDWRSGGPRFKSHPRLTFQSWSSYQLNQLGSKAVSDSTLKQLNTCGVLYLYSTFTFTFHRTFSGDSAMIGYSEKSLLPATRKNWQFNQFQFYVSSTV